MQRHPKNTKKFPKFTVDISQFDFDAFSLESLKEDRKKFYLNFFLSSSK